MIAPRRPRAAIALLAGVIGLLGLFAIPVLDRDEARFAQATAQMLESRDFVDIRFQDEARHKKPVGVHWLQAASTALFSNAQARAIWTYRAPSVLALMLAGIFIFEAGRALGGPHARTRGWIAGLIGVTSLCAAVEAHIAKTDASLMAACAAIIAAVIHVRAASEEGRPARGWAYGFWAALGVGLLLKGPVAAIFAACLLVSFCLWRKEARWLLRLRPATGSLLTALIAAPWFVAIGLATEGAFFGEALGADFGAKLIGGQESHGAPPGLHLALLPLTFWPGILLAPAGLALAVKERADWRAQMLLCAILPFWLLLELTPTKLPHYILPITPALAVVAAGAAVRPEAAAFARKIGVAVYLFAGFTLVAAIGAAAAMFSDKNAGAFAAAIVAVAGFAALSEAICKRALHGLAARALRLGLLTAFLLYVIAFQLVAPTLTPLRLAAEVKTRLDERGLGGPAAVAGLSEPSFVFTLGTDTRFLEAREAALALARGEVRVAIVAADRREAFEAVFEAAASPPERIAEVSGLNYSKGERVTLTLYRLAAPRADEADVPARPGARGEP